MTSSHMLEYICVCADDCYYVFFISAILQFLFEKELMDDDAKACNHGTVYGYLMTVIVRDFIFVTNHFLF